MSVKSGISVDNPHLQALLPVSRHLVFDPELEPPFFEPFEPESPLSSMTEAR